MTNMKVVVLEAGKDYLEQVETFHMDVSGTKNDMVERAMKEASTRGYHVFTYGEGGACEYVNVSDGEDYIAVTVHPEYEIKIIEYLGSGRYEYYVGLADGEVFFAWLFDEPRPMELLPKLLAQAIADLDTNTDELGAVAGTQDTVIEEIEACADAMEITDEELADDIRELILVVEGYMAGYTKE